MGRTQVTLTLGIYIIKDGPLIGTNTASFSGTDAGPYFNGDNSGLLFNQGTTISLTAPTSGLRAGLLMMEDRSVGSILDSAVLLNALLPTGRVVVDASGPVADQSACTVVVARQVNLCEGPNLNLNANYDVTSCRCPRASVRSAARS